MQEISAARKDGTCTKTTEGDAIQSAPPPEAIDAPGLGFLLSGTIATRDLFLHPASWLAAILLVALLAL